MILQFGFTIEVVRLHTCDLTSKIFNYSFTMFIKDMHATYIFLTWFLILTQEPEELFETISQALLSSVDRDCLSGWGGHVYVV